MSWLRVLVLGIGLVGVSVAAAQDGKNAGKLDPNKLVGTWKLVSGKYGGRKSTLPEVQVCSNNRRRQVTKSLFAREGKP